MKEKTLYNDSFLDKAIKFIACVAGVMVIGWLAGMLGGADKGYSNLVRPAFTPPDLVFSIVWPILYALMGVSFYLIINDKNLNGGVRIASILIFALQLTLNVIYVPVFFNAQAYLIAFVILAVLTATVTALIFINFKLNKLSAIMLLPYLAWLFFAVYLNACIVALNC